MSGKTTALLASALLMGGCQAPPMVHPPQQPAPVAAATERATSAPPPASPAAADQAAEAALAASPPPPPATEPPEPGDLWQRLRSGFALPGKQRPEVRVHTRWYATHQSYMDRVGERAAPYLHIIVEAVEARGMPGEIALLPTIESAFRPFASSSVRAAGLWQFIPSTGRHYGLKQTWWYDGRRDVQAATDAALSYLQRLHRRFDNDWLLALAAYNCGEGKVAKAMRNNRRRGRPADFWSLKLPRETRNYVPSLLGLSTVVADPERYDIALRPIPDTPYLASVDVGGQIDLALVAELTELSVKDIYRYNPGFNRFATDPQGPHRLLLPVDVAEAFEDKLSALPEDKRLHWKRHVIRKGESLSLLAARYDTSVQALRSLNRLRGDVIAVGKVLLIPVAHQDAARYAGLAAALPAGGSGKAAAKPKRHPKLPGSGTKTTYRVRRGDTLWDIARAHRVGVKRLAAWNGLGRRDTLHPGQALVVWHRPPKAALAPTSEPVPTAGDQPVLHYEVRKGDSLWLISRRFKVAVDDLIAWNKLPKQGYIKPGQKLRLYVDKPSSSGTS
jgi:membrane-bound lytic murein transglycosylase D